MLLKVDLVSQMISKYLFEKSLEEGFFTQLE